MSIYNNKVLEKEDAFKDFLIVSYNEGATNFTSSDCDQLIEKIRQDDPLIICICTQESESLSSTPTHYQHIFEERLTKSLNNYKRLSKQDGSTKIGHIIAFAKTEKNVRTRVYYNTNNINKSNNIIKKRSYSNMFYGKEQEKTEYNPTKYEITNVETKKSTESNFGKSSASTLYKGSLFTKVEIKGPVRYSNTKSPLPQITYKLIFINSHLFYKKDGNTGLKQRAKEFLDLMKEFKLAYYYGEGYSIFFCGDLNFRIFKQSINLSTNKNFKISENMAKQIINLSNNNLNNTSNELNRIILDLQNLLNKKVNNHMVKQLVVMNNQPIIPNSQLVFTNNQLSVPNNQSIDPKLLNIIKNFSNNIITDENKEKHKKLLKQFQKYITKFGKHLTCKYHEGFTNNSPKTCEGRFSCKPDSYPRIPSMCDKILCAINEQYIKVEKSDFNVLDNLRKSDHLMVTLTGMFIK